MGLFVRAPKHAHSAALVVELRVPGFYRCADPYRV